MQGISRNYTCLVAALAVVGEMKNIVEGDSEDLEWCTSDKADDFLGGKYHPKGAVAFLQVFNEFEADVLSASDTVELFNDGMYFVASIEAEAWLEDEMKASTFVLVFDRDQVLVAVMEDIHFAHELKSLVVGP